MSEIYAEDYPYWNTTVPPAKSQAEILEMLEQFGASHTLVAQGQAGGRLAWMIRFTWQGATYRWTFAPLPCRTPRKVVSFGGKRRTHQEQSAYQMGRIARHFCKAILAAAESHPHALFGFIEIPAAGSPGALPPTAGQLDVRGLVEALPEISIGPETILLPPGQDAVEE